MGMGLCLCLWKAARGHLTCNYNHQTERYLKTGYEFLRLDGSVTGNERQAVIECESLVPTLSVSVDSLTYSFARMLNLM